MTIVPKSLRIGETIGIVAPAGWVAEKELQPALNYLVEKGFKIRLGASVFTKDRYLAGSDQARLKDVHSMFENQEVKAIFCARGGYGCSRLLDKVNYALIQRNPKILVGFSDTTALQLAIYVKTGLVSYTGLALSTDVTIDQHLPLQTEKSLWNLLLSGDVAYHHNLEILKEGRASGPLLGGCLSLLCSLVGTSYFPEMDGAILFIEDVNEASYRVDRMLTQLRLAGVLERINGLIYGQFIGCDSKNNQHGAVEPVLAEFSEHVAGPVLQGLLYGHTPNRYVLPLGVQAHVSTDSNKGSLATMN